MAVGVLEAFCTGASSLDVARLTDGLALVVLAESGSVICGSTGWSIVEESFCPISAL